MRLVSAKAARRVSTPPPQPPLHELESEIMEELWSRGEASVREVMDALNQAARAPRAYTTYMTVMARLHTKGLLHRQRQGKADIYVPVAGREEYRVARAGVEVNALLDRFGDAALVHFARQMDGLDAARLRQLRALARKERGGGDHRP